MSGNDMIAHTVGRRQLLESLRACDQPFRLQRLPDGSELLLLQHGGRVLGLFAAGREQDEEDNFFWTHPALQSARSAHDLFAAPKWQNTGGDRTWLAPEVDLFFPNFPDETIYECPPAMDPGRYEAMTEMVGTRPSTRLVNRCEVALARGRVSVGVEIGKSWRPAPNPIREQAIALMDGVAYAGYTQVTTLAITSPSADEGDRGRRASAIGLWGLAQLPPDGEFIVPLSMPTAAAATLYLGSVAPDELRITCGQARYRSRTAGVHKLGFRAERLGGHTPDTGTIGYIYSSGEAYVLVVRNFAVQRDGLYVDVAWRTPADFDEPGCAAQICAIDHPRLGRYVETEHHAPALRVAERGRTSDTSHLWAFRGCEPAIRAIADHLLRVDDD